MARAIIFILGLLLGMSPGVWASQDDIVIVLSSRLVAYKKAVAGFREICEADMPRAGPKCICPHHITELVNTDFKSQAELRRRIEELGPAIVLAVGTNALNTATSLSADIPVIHLLVPFPEALKNNRPHIYGVAMDIDPAAQLSALIETMPQARRVGVVFDPAKTGELVQKAREFCRVKGLSLVSREAESPAGVPDLISSLRGEIDVFWMIPDLTVVTPQTTEFLFLFSLENRVPVLTFAEKYLELGATFMVGPDAFAMGKTAFELVKQILAGKEKPRPLAPGPRPKVVVNTKIAEKLGIRLETGDERSPAPTVGP